LAGNAIPVKIAVARQELPKWIINYRIMGRGNREDDMVEMVDLLDGRLVIRACAHVVALCITK